MKDCHSLKGAHSILKQLNHFPLAGIVLRWVSRACLLDPGVLQLSDLSRKPEHGNSSLISSGAWSLSLLSIMAGSFSVRSRQQLCRKLRFRIAYPGGFCVTKVVSIELRWHHLWIRGCLISITLALAYSVMLYTPQLGFLFNPLVVHRKREGFSFASGVAAKSC